MKWYKLASLVGPLYHGTRTVFEDFDPEKKDPDSLYGPGFYFTDSPDVASGYAGSHETVKKKFLTEEDMKWFMEEHPSLTLVETSNETNTGIRGMPVATHDTLTIYHTSPERITEILLGYGPFGDVLFFSQAPYSMSPAAKQYVYSIEIDPDKILDVTRLFYLHEGNEPPIVETLQRMMKVLKVNEKEAQRLLTDEDNVFDYAIEDPAEASWWIQRLQAELARDLGYEAAEMEDEHGTSYAIPMMGREKDLKLEKNESNPPCDRE